MANYCFSVKLAACCCTRNYLQHVCKSKKRIIYARSFSFVWSEYSDTALLVCNDVLIGVVDKGNLCVYSQFKPIVSSRSMLLSIMAYFNLYPC